MGHGVAALLLILGSLLIGMLGYMHFERLPAVDAFLNAAMLLGGMGPVDLPHTVSGKVFAGLYALYSGLLFLVTAAVLFTPVLHRLLHRFHWTDGGN
ncbi:MAG: hypothetical protein RLZZ200_1991 [Pseudomonadota bacterium]|jgi:hypothetical protein